MSKDAAVQLVTEVSAKITDLVREFRQRATAQKPAVQDPGVFDVEVLLRIARQLVDQRRRRHGVLPADLFHEPAWNMLLTLFIAYQSGQALNTKALVSTAGAPATTAQRWIEHLDKLGLITRVIDPADRRRIEVSLNDAGYQAMTRYLEDVAKRERENRCVFAKPQSQAAL